MQITGHMPHLSFWQINYLFSCRCRSSYKHISHCQDFEDITVGFTLEDKPKSKLPDLPNLKQQQEDELKLQVSQQEMYRLSQIHQKLLLQFTTTRWLCGKGSDNRQQLDWVEPMMECYHVAADIVKTFSAGLDLKIDQQLIGGHLLTSTVLQSTVNNKLIDWQNSESKPYDFYHDPNVPEVVKCRPLLARYVTAGNGDIMSRKGRTGEVKCARNSELYKMPF